MIATKAVSAGAWHSLGLGIATVWLMDALSAGLWLPTRGANTITSAVPGGKVLFPLAVIPLSMVIPLGYLVGIRHPRIKFKMIGIGLWALAVALLSLLYQRGFVVGALIVTAFLAERVGQLSYKRAFGLALVGLFLLAVFKPVAVAFSSLFSPHSLTTVDFNFGQRVAVFILGPNFDGADVWPVAMEKVRLDGELSGSTFLAMPARLIPPNARRELGLLTAVDALNEFYWGEHYWQTNFGFNVNLAQELYINFNMWIFFLGILPGLATGLIDQWLWHVKSVTVFRLYAIAGAFFTGAFAGEIAGVLQWVAAYLLLGLVIELFTRVRFRAHRRLPALAQSPR